MNSNFVNVFSVYATVVFKLYNTTVLFYWIYYVFMLEQISLLYYRLLLFLLPGQLSYLLINKLSFKLSSLDISQISLVNHY